MGNGTQTWLRNLTSWIGRVWLWSLRFCSSGATSIVNGLWLKGIAMPNLERHSTFNFYIEWWRKNNWTGQSGDVWWCMMYDVCVFSSQTSHVCTRYVGSLHDQGFFCEQFVVAIWKEMGDSFPISCSPWMSQNDLQHTLETRKLWNSSMFPILIILESSIWICPSSCVIVHSQKPGGFWPSRATQICMQVGQGWSGEERFEWCLEFPFRVLYGHSCPFTYDFIGYDDDDDDDDDDDFRYSNWNSQSISCEGLQMPWQRNCGSRPRPRLHILTPSTLQGGVQMNAISRTAALGLQDQWPIAVELFAELRRQSLVEGEFMCNSVEISCNNLNL